MAIGVYSLYQIFDDGGFITVYHSFISNQRILSLKYNLVLEQVKLMQYIVTVENLMILRIEFGKAFLPW